MPYGVCWRRLPVRKVRQFQYSRFNASNPGVIRRCRDCCIRATLFKHSTKLLARHACRRTCRTCATALMATGPDNASTSPVASSTPRNAAADKPAPRNPSGRWRRPSACTAASRISGDSGKAASRSRRDPGMSRTAAVSVPCASRRDGLSKRGSDRMIPSAGARVFNSPVGVNNCKASRIVAQAFSPPARLRRPRPRSVEPGPRP